MRRFVELSSLLTLAGVMFVALTVLPARAAELVMFEQVGCPWCARFDRDVAPAYEKSDEGRRAPLRRVDIDKPLPPDLAFVQVERLTPLFVLVDKGREIGRIRGYPGEESFWMQLTVLFQKLESKGPSNNRARILEKTMHARG
ncbi:MAG TPA: transcriptional regulator [Pseudolabrys sp.]|jgi:hypothetical protein|nr:transcriptional regulator [Pseudolabrys sp.]